VLDSLSFDVAAGERFAVGLCRVSRKQCGRSEAASSGARGGLQALADAPGDAGVFDRRDEAIVDSLRGQ
jgi:hypothetical protein